MYSTKILANAESDGHLDVYVKVGKVPGFYHGNILRDFWLGLIMGRFYVAYAVI